MSFSVAMNQFVETILQGAGLIAIIVIILGSLRQLHQGTLRHSLMLGALFGLTICLLEELTVQGAHGLELNGRFMGVALAAAFGGLPAFVVAATLGAISHGWATDVFEIATLAGPLLCGAVALLWRWKLKSTFHNHTSSLIMLGVMLSFPLVIVHNSSIDTDAARPSVLLMWAGATAAAMLLSLMIGIALERQKNSLLREQALLMASLRDPLTGLHNRRSFDAELHTILARKGDHTLLFVDVDHFKTLNDRFGHVVGDQALQTIAHAMSQSVRHDDIVARIGGEEFGIILPDISHPAAKVLAERLLAAVSGCNLEVGGERVVITISIGVAHGQPEQSATSLLRMADAALYEAKSLGRRRVVVRGEPTKETAVDVAVSGLIHKAG